MISHNIANSILSSRREKVFDAAARKLVSEVAKHPIYQSA
jgi:hypothetical protein